jgi:hypothetical protein
MMVDVMFARSACRASLSRVAGETVGATVGVAVGRKEGTAVGLGTGADVSKGSN